MAERLKRQTVQMTVDNINEELRRLGKSCSVSVSKTYEYFTVSLNVGGLSTASSFLYSGTLRECFTYLQGMIQSINIVLYKR